MANGIEAMFHYFPLHLAEKGSKIGRFIGGEITENTSKQLLRLPMHDELKTEEVQYIVESVRKFYLQ